MIHGLKIVEIFEIPLYNINVPVWKFRCFENFPFLASFRTIMNLKCLNSNQYTIFNIKTTSYCGEYFKSILIMNSIQSELIRFNVKTYNSLRHQILRLIS